MLNWILSQFKQQSARDLERAREMVKAAAGGSPIDPVKARDVARALRIEVGVNASVDQVISEIRRYLTHHGAL